MKVYVLSLSAGLLVGVVYGLIGVRSPAPPVVALVGLLGILLGEQVVPVARQVLGAAPFRAAVARAECLHHMFGHLPGRQGAVAANPDGAATPSSDLT